MFLADTHSRAFLLETKEDLELEISVDQKHLLLNNMISSKSMHLRIRNCKNVEALLRIDGQKTK